MKTEDEAFLADTLALLGRTPLVLHALLTGMPDAWLETTDTPDGWRPRDVVGHLITGERTNYIRRAERIIESGTAVPFDAFDRFAQHGRDDAKSLDDLVAEFASLRAQNLARLDELVSPADLGRHGTHPAMGDVTLRQLLASWAVHDLDHVSQAFAGMAGSYDAEVGPWKMYLGILLRREDPSAVPG